MSAYGRRATVADLPLFSGAADYHRAGAAALRPGASYPEHPGSKRDGTSRESADAVASEARILRDAVMAALREHGPMTADQVAEVIRRSVLATRPRLSELRALGKIVATGERRRNRSGMSAAVWRCA